MSEIRIESLLTKDELYTLNLTLCDVLINNPINIERIISVLKMVGKASSYGLDASEIIKSDLEKRKHFTVLPRKTPFPPHQTRKHFNKCRVNILLPFRLECVNSEDYCNWKGFEKELLDDF